VYVVAGSSGQTSGGQLNHPAMFISLNNLGSLVVDVDTNRMDVKFLRETGAIGDYFTMTKGGTVTIPPAPTSLTATPGNAQVVLNWSAASGATSYNVKRSTVNGGPYTTIATGVTSTTFTNTGLSNGTTYYFVVSASNSAGESPNSTQVSATPQPPAAPAAPMALTATGGKNKITLRWTQSNSPNLQFNRIYRSNTSGGPYTLVAQVAPRTSYNDPVAGGQTRYYVVTAVNTSGGESSYSNQAGATAK
jgi:cellulose 1,4-beta-cellobiosidase